MVATIEKATQPYLMTPAGGDSPCEPTLPPAGLRPKIQMSFRLPFGSLAEHSGCCMKPQNELLIQAQFSGGALASTHRWKRRRHVEDGSLASLKTGPKQINADHQDLALAA